MTEEGGQTATTTEAATITETTETPKMFGENGGFTENWTHTLTDAALHDNPTLKSAKTVEALAAMTVSAQKMVGSDKIAAPNEASSEAEWDAYHKAGGRPETADDYAFARPEELPEEYYHADRAKAAQELFHKIGISKEQADILFAFNNDYAIADLKQQTQDAEMAATAADDSLHADWGSAYDQKIHMGETALKNGCEGESEEFTVLAQKEFKANPKFKRLLANLGSKFVESGAIKIEQIPTPGDIQEQIDNITASGAYSPDYAKKGFTRAQHDAAVNKAMQLRTSNMENVKTG